MKSFFHRNPKLLGLSRQFGQIRFGAVGAFLADLSAPIGHFGTVSPLSIFSINQPLFLQKIKALYVYKSQIFIWDWDLNLGYKQLGI